MRRPEANKYIRAYCPHCREKRSVAINEFFGRYVICPRCGNRFKWNERRIDSIILNYIKSIERR